MIVATADLLAMLKSHFCDTQKTDVEHHRQLLPYKNVQIV